MDFTKTPLRRLHTPEKELEIEPLFMPESRLISGPKGISMSQSLGPVNITLEGKRGDMTSYVESLSSGS